MLVRRVMAAALEDDTWPEMEKRVGPLRSKPAWWLSGSRRSKVGERTVVTIFLKLDQVSKVVSSAIFRRTPLMWSVPMVVSCVF